MLKTDGASLRVLAHVVLGQQTTSVLFSGRAVMWLTLDGHHHRARTGRAVGHDLREHRNLVTVFALLNPGDQRRRCA